MLSKVLSRISTFHAIHSVLNLFLGELQVPNQMWFAFGKRNAYTGKISVSPSMVSNHMACVIRVFDAGGDVGAVDAVIVVTARATTVRIELQ